MAQLGKVVKGKSKDARKKKKEKNLTAEDRAMLQKGERTRQADEQKRQAIENRMRLRNQMERERELSHMNRMKIQNQWRKIMRLLKVESLRKDIEVLSQSHERDVDRKDAIIQMLDRDLEEAEEQYQMALRSHLQHLDSFVDLQDSRLAALEADFEEQLMALENEFNAERIEIMNQHTRERKELNDIMEAAENLELQKESESKQEHEQQREEIREKNLEDIKVLQVTLEQSIGVLEEHFETAHRNYLQTTERRTQEFKELTDKDDEMSGEIDSKTELIDKLYLQLGHWRTKITQNKKECEDRNKALMEEKDAVMRHFQELKGRMNRFRQLQSRRLTELTVNARNAQKELQEKIDIAEKVIKLGELSRKLETDRELVLPFIPVDSSAVVDGKAAEILEAARAAEEEAISQARESEDLTKVGRSAAIDNPGLHPQITDDQNMPIDEWTYLDNFWNRYNRTVLDKLAIEQEKDRLEKENQELRSILKQYLDGVSVNDDVISGPNPLLVVNGRVNLNAPPPRLTAKPAVVEASHHVRVAMR